VEQLGPPADIYNRPATPFVARFVGDTNVFPARISRVEDGRAWVDIEPLATCLPVGPTPEGLGSGDRVSVSVRPENVEIAEPVASSGGLQGRLEDAIYAGAHVRCRVSVHGADVLANVPTGPSRSARFEIGQVVAVRWQPQDCIVQRSET